MRSHAIVGFGRTSYRVFSTISLNASSYILWNPGNAISIIVIIILIYFQRASEWILLGRCDAKEHINFVCP